MNLLIKSLSQKSAIVFIVLLLSACGGSDSSRDARSATADLEQLAANVVAQPLVVAPVPNPLNPSDPTDIASTNDIASAAATATALAAGAPAGTFINVGLPGIADVYIGTLDLPYYFDTTNSLTSSWSPSLALVETITVPVMMTIPNVGSRPSDGWPIVMYQHGITRNRTDIIAYADAQAQAGFAVIAIDLPTHGVDATNPFNASNSPFPTDIEQTFGANAVSGENFINIPSLLTSRDNLRQGVANLLTLRESLGGIVNVATMMPVKIDTSRVGLIAHSLGGMVAIPYLAVETTSTPSSIVMAGATISEVLQESVSFSPRIAFAIAALGVTTPEDVNAFYATVQETVDAAEPANYAATAAANHPIHLIEVLGDATVPNSATENLAQIMGATPVSTTTPGITAGNTGIVRFTEGEHGSPLTPDRSINSDGTENTIQDQDYIAVTTEIQRQLASFQGSAISASGPVIVITNGCIIEDGVCTMTAQ